MNNNPTKYWRADGGYQDAPEQLNQAQMACYPGYGPWMCQPMQQFQPWPQQCQPMGWMNGPIGINGLCTPPPQYGTLSPAPPPAPCCQPASPQEEKKDGKKENHYAPPKLPDGANYLFDKDHTMVHIFSKAAPVWEEKYQKEKLKFKMFKTSVNFTVKMIIERVMNKEGDDCKEWCITEAVERGAGKWDKGTTIEYDSDKAKGTLQSMGWSKKRGDVLPPVWLVVHKKDFK